MCWNCSNTTEHHLQQRFPLKTERGSQRSGWCEPVNPAETLCVIFGQKKWTFLWPGWANAVLVTAGGVMADVTSSSDYGSALLAATSEPADADSLDQIILKWQKEIDRLPFCSLWFDSISLFSARLVDQMLEDTRVFPACANTLLHDTPTQL